MNLMLEEDRWVQQQKMKTNRVMVYNHGHCDGDGEGMKVSDARSAKNSLTFSVNKDRPRQMQLIPNGTEKRTHNNISFLKNTQCPSDTTVFPTIYKRRVLDIRWVFPMATISREQRDDLWCFNSAGRTRQREARDEFGRRPTGQTKTTDGEMSGGVAAIVRWKSLPERTSIGHRRRRAYLREREQRKCERIK